MVRLKPDATIGVETGFKTAIVRLKPDATIGVKNRFQNRHGPAEAPSV
jgi:hypothetical protein